MIFAMTHLAIHILPLFPLPAIAQEAAPVHARAVHIDTEAGGLRWGDFDGDGRLDLLTIDELGQARLLRNLGDGGFDDLTASVGLEQAAPLADATWIDVDADGRLDLFVLSTAGTPRMFRQRRGSQFEDSSVALGLDELTEVMHATWLDYDGDGLRDLQIRTHSAEVLLHNAGTRLVEALRIPVRAQRGAPMPTAGLSLQDTPPTSELGAPSGSHASSSAPQTPVLACDATIHDAGNPGNCIGASSIPMLGKLLPLGTEFFVDSGTGNVGVGTTTPVEKLAVEGGNIRTDGQLISTEAVSAPLVVSSSVLVTGLNADQLDGLEASSFSQLGDSIEGDELADEAVTNGKIATAAITSEKIGPDAVGASQLGRLVVNDSHVAVLAAIDGSKIVPTFAGDVTATGAVGAGVTTPLATVHAVGTPTLGSVWICPAETGSGADSELLLAEDDNGTFGIKMRYNATANQLEILGRADDVDAAEPMVVVARDSGKMSIGNNGVQAGHLTVNGSSDTGTSAIEVLAGAGPGMHVSSTSTSDPGVLVETSGASVAALDGRATYRGVSGESTSSVANGSGVYGLASASTGAVYGVFGEAHSSSGVGVQGQATTASGFTYGVSGSTLSSSGRGVAGFAFSTTGLNYGVRGFTASAGGYGVYSSGDLAASGVKAFIQPHPEDPSKEIRFVCLEGNEAGTYFRGSGQLSGGLASIQVPDEFRLVSEHEGVTIQLTPRGRGSLWVEASDRHEILVAGTTDVDFDYLVNGVRRGFKDLTLVRENTSFVPTQAGVPFGTQYPAGLRQVLVENGTLNADGTPNEATAESMDWPLQR
ncbi:MAG: hypothetical protein ACI8QZ_000566 [Chlamydiales bacterium]|jgi:hypothetical protein